MEERLQDPVLENPRSLTKCLPDLPTQYLLHLAANRQQNRGGVQASYDGGEEGGGGGAVNGDRGAGEEADGWGEGGDLSGGSNRVSR